jgi:cytidylate kinase
MVTLQRKMGEIGNVVLDGRDIGTHVFPNADVKIFLSAPVKARALRRFLENKEKGINISYDDLVLDLERRDYADSTRAISPLKQAEDAVYLDNSNLNIEETAEKIIEIIKEKTGGK